MNPKEGESLEKVKLFVYALPNDGSTLKKGQRGPVVSTVPSFMKELHERNYQKNGPICIFLRIR